MIFLPRRDFYNMLSEPGISKVDIQFKVLEVKILIKSVSSRLKIDDLNWKVATFENQRKGEVFKRQWKLVR